MTASTLRTICPPNVYTLISDGNNNCTFVPPSIYGGRMAFGMSLPAPNHLHYKTCAGGVPVELGNMGTTKIYWMPLGTAEQAIDAMVGP